MGNSCVEGSLVVMQISGERGLYCMYSNISLEFGLRVETLLTWFIIFIYFWNVLFLNNVITIKTKVLLPQA